MKKNNSLPAVATMWRHCRTKGTSWFHHQKGATATRKRPALKSIALCTMLVATAQSPLCAQTYPFQDATLSFHERAVDLVSRLTLKEKIAQMGNMVDTKVSRDGIELPIYQYWNEALHGVARSGAATSFPESKAMSASWDRQLIFDCATATSDEARIYNNTQNKGLNYWCPTINMSRDPRWGRDEENYGEDPFLAGTLAVQFIRGMQGEQTADNPYFKTIACAKHFAANNYEQGRQGSTSFMTEHMLREYYLPAFEMAVKQGNVQSIMSAYNALSTDLNEKNAAGIGWSAKKSWGGKPCAMNDVLLTQILRNEWGFNGYVTSDCAGISCIYRQNKHNYFGDNADGSALQDQLKARATALAIKAGNDMNCEFKNQTSVYQTALDAAIAEGLMTEADLDRALVRVLETRFALGEFDADVPWRNISNDRLECDEHQQLALKAAREAIVLLKNENQLLPLSPDKKIALIGPYANQIMLGDYSGTPTYTTTPFQAFAQKMNFNVSDGTVQAENFSEAVVSKRGAAQNNKGAGNLENTAPGDIFLYRNINFGDGCTLFEMACGAKNTGLGQVSFALDNADATPFLTVSNQDTGGWTKWVTVSAELDPATVKGTHDLYVIFSGTNSYVGNYDFFKFYNPNAIPLETVGPLYMVETSGSVNTPASQDAIQRAVAVAKKADVVVFLGGTNYEKMDDHLTGTESHDRFKITLPGNQEDLLKQLQKANPNIVLVLETNSSMDISWEKQNLPAIVEAWYGGQAQGQAICDVLFGDYNPGGKLTSTWYNSLSELPSASDSQFGANGMLEYNIDEWGYTYMYYGRSKHQKQASKPMYPFGYGLSYTTFGYSNFRQSSSSIAQDETVEISADITNTGQRSGAEVVQLYVSFPGSAIGHRPTRKLVGFERVELEPGETKTVTMPLSHDQLAYYNEATSTFDVEDGTVNLYVSASSADDRLNGQLNVSGGIVKTTYKSQSDGIETVSAPLLTASKHVYNLQGNCVSTLDRIDTLPKGIYIVNGEKRVVR